MAETFVKDIVCEACGSEARPQAQFCYHCGGPLEVVEVKNEVGASDVWFQEEISENAKEEEISRDEKGSGNDLKSEETVDDLASKEETNEKLEEAAEDEKDEGKKISVRSKPVTEEDEGKKDKETKREKKDLKSAASLRKRSKPSRLKMVEVVWEENESSPNGWFVGFGLVLALLAAGLILLSFYLK